MLLSEIFEYLTYGELSQLELGGAEDGSIEQKDYPKIISWINMAMIDLYKRFDLRERQVVIQLYANITEYRLSSDFAVTNVDSVEPVKYIEDTATHPFTDDILQIESVWDEAGEEIPLNNIDEELSVFTPEYDLLQMPYPEDENAITLVYRAQPDKIVAKDIDPTATKVALPDQLLAALLSFVGHRAYSAMDTAQQSTEGTSYYTKYLAQVRDVKNQGGILKAQSTNTRLDDNGWQ